MAVEVEFVRTKEASALVFWMLLAHEFISALMVIHLYSRGCLCCFRGLLGFVLFAARWCVELIHFRQLGWTKEFLPSDNKLALLPAQTTLRHMVSIFSRFIAVDRL